jgi:hypothetical protein
MNPKNPANFTRGLFNKGEKIPSGSQGKLGLNGKPIPTSISIKFIVVMQYYFLLKF